MNPQQQQINVDISKADDITCENCGNYTFQEVALMKRLSPIMSPTGKEAVVPIPTFACNACGHINKRFLPVSYNTTEEEQTEEAQAPKLTLEN